MTKVVETLWNTIMIAKEKEEKEKDEKEEKDNKKRKDNIMIFTDDQNLYIKLLI